MRLKVRLSLVIAVTIVVAALVPVGQVVGEPALASSGRALVLLHSEADLDQVVSDIQAAGGRVIHTFPPAALIAEQTGDLSKTAGVQAVHRQEVGRAAMTALDEDVRGAAQAWNYLLAPTTAGADSRSLESLPADLANDAFQPQVPLAATVSAAGEDPTPSFRQTSEFFIGRVAVGIVMPQSNGGSEASTETWTKAERDTVLGEITAALDWWAAREPSANLTFVYDDNGGEPVSTSYEPISHPYRDEYLWIGEIMEEKGFSGSSHFQQVYAYNNALRDTHDTDWAFTIFVVDSSADPDDRFSDGFFAYAYTGGPFAVVTSGNGGYGIQHLDSVAAHEIGHIFHALDQYAGAGRACTKEAGYLAVENQNSQSGDCLLDEPSIMRSHVEPFAAGAVDSYARGQVGWRDSDEDGILDPVDNTIVLTETDYVTDATRTNVFQFEGTAYQEPYPSDASVTINTIEAVDYRVANGDWQEALPTDGAFDAWNESYHFTTDSLPTGEFAVHVRVTDSWGNTLTRRVATVSSVNPADGTINTTLTRVEVGGAEAAPPSLTYRAQAVSDISHISAAYYRLDSGKWQLLEPDDGAFNDSEETFTFSIASDALSSGTHELQVYSVDGDGNAEQPPVSDTFAIEGQDTQDLVYLFLPLVQ